MNNSLKRFAALESSSGIVLLLAAVLALLWANSPLDFLHQRFIEDWLFFINEGLMAIFFLDIGLELKKGYLSGELSRPKQILLPAVAALGGMLVPALVFVAFNLNKPELLPGWATPIATDIAFAMGVLALVGRGIPPGLRLFLLVLAIFDDIGAIIVIAFFYSSQLSLIYLFGAIVVTIAIYIVNRSGITNLIPYIIAGLILWFAVLNAGIHPAIAGVVMGLVMPAHDNLQNRIQPFVAFLIMPLFALANAGFSLTGVQNIFSNTLIMGIVLGLFIGKQLGVFGFSWLMIRLRLATMPGKCHWHSLYGVSLLCGIGFTMSLFLGTLSFQGDSPHLTDVRLGVLLGSLLSGIAGALVLLKKEKHH